MSNPVRFNSLGAFAWMDDRQRWHRIDGPAILYDDGDMSWYINGMNVSTNADYQMFARISDEDMLALILKYGDIK